MLERKFRVAASAERACQHLGRLEPPHRWMWQGPFLGMTVHYDHQFTPRGAAYRFRGPSLCG